jgi:hypothetical protein
MSTFSLLSAHVRMWGGLDDFTLAPSRYQNSGSEW